MSENGGIGSMSCSSSLGRIKVNEEKISLSCTTSI